MPSGVRNVSAAVLGNITWSKVDEVQRWWQMVNSNYRDETTANGKCRGFIVFFRSLPLPRRPLPSKINVGSRRYMGLSSGQALQNTPANVWVCCAPFEHEPLKCRTAAADHTTRPNVNRAIMSYHYDSINVFHDVAFPYKHCP